MQVYKVSNNHKDLHLELLEVVHCGINKGGGIVSATKVASYINSNKLKSGYLLEFAVCRENCLMYAITPILPSGLDMSSREFFDLSLGNPVNKLFLAHLPDADAINLASAISSISWYSQ